MAAAGVWSQARACARVAQYCLAFAVLLAVVLVSESCRAQPVKGDASFATSGGYGRLTLRLAEDVESDVTTAGMIVVIRFKRPVDIAVEKLADSAPDYIGSARRDPDGSAIRLALARKVTVNAMAAGERLFVDLLPESWTGAPPGLPQDVVRELSERARVAERALRLQRASADLKKRPPIRVRTSVQPTFVRYVFETPDDVAVSSTLGEQKLAILFNAALNFDLADAKLAMPPNIGSISQKVEGPTSTVEVALIGSVDVHSFREDKNFVVDIGFPQPEGSSLAKIGPAGLVLPPAAGHDKPAAEHDKPAAGHDAAGHDKPATAAAAHGADPIRPPTPESVARKAQPAKPTQAKAAHGEAVRDAKAEAKMSAAPDVKPEVKPAPAGPSAITSAAVGPAPMKPAMAGPKAVLPAPAGPSASKLATAGADAMPAAAPAPKPMAPAPAGPNADKSAEAASAGPSEQAMPMAPIAAVKQPETTAAPTKPVAAPEPSGPATPVEARRSADGLRLTFGFAAPTPAALFRRAENIWLVLDSNAPFDLEAIRREGGTAIGDVSKVALPTGQAIRIRLNRPQLAALRDDDSGSGRSWSVILADSGQAPSAPLTAVRNISDPARASVSVALAGAGKVHALVDPEAGDALQVITALPPPRGFIKRQDFVEFALLESIHGLVVQRNADDVKIEAGADVVMLSRPGGLTLSSGDAGAQRGAGLTRPFFDVNQWSKDQEGSFIDRLRALVDAASQAGGGERLPARLDLARFYMARGMYQEAKGVLDLALSDTKVGQEDPAAMIGHAAASALMGRPAQTLKDITNPAIASGYDAQLWKAFAIAQQGKWAEAREKFKSVEFAITALPLDMQRVLIATAMRASLEVKDYSGAAARSRDLDLVGVPPAMTPMMTLMRGRLDEALGRDQEALIKYHNAIVSPDRQAASEATLRELILKQKRDEISATDLLPELERLAVTWRGDEQEVKVQQMLSRFYADLGRYRESLAAARTATELLPNSDAARDAQDDSRALFAKLFLGTKGDDLPPIEALATFYEFRELTPVGRRGDEMIRRLADRLVAVDLLDQASELLQYQVDKRLEGAARAGVAAKLAMIYLMNRKPDRAIAALRTTRISDLAGEVRQQRLLLEARAQSDIGRHDLALDIIANSGGREAIRLRSDIYWASRRWREASEQIELYLGERWRDFRPLTAAEKGDVIRAAVGYALAEDALGSARFREKFAPLMTDAADRTALDTASMPSSGNSSEFGAIAKMAASVDTLDGFLREMRQRFPDASAKAIIPGADRETTGSLPAIVGVKSVEAAR